MQHIERFIANFGAIVRRLADEIHDSVGGALVALSPMLATIPSAWALWTATGNLSVALAVEAVGFGSIWTAMQLQRATGKWAAPVTLASVYVGIATALLFGYKVAPSYVAMRAGLATYGDVVIAWATMMLPLLSLVGASTYAIMDYVESTREAAAERKQAQAEEAQQRRAWEMELQRRQAELDLELQREKELAKIRRADMKASARVSTQPSTSGQNTSTDASPTSGGQSSTDDLVDSMLDVWRIDPHASLRTVAETIGRSKSWVGKQRKQLEADGVIHANGNGVEVL